MMTKLLKAFGLLAITAAVASLAPAHAQTTVRYLHTDALGTVVAKTDANGNVVERTTFEPYGAVVGGAVADGPGYTGHVSDAATGLSYMQQRYYDPEVGIFLSVDPVTAYSEPVEQFGRYRYGNGNPYRFRDPDGRSATLLAPVVIVPLVVVTTYFATTTSEQRADIGRQLEGGLKDILQKSEPSPKEPALQGDGSIVSEREPGSDGKRGSTGGPGAGKRFPKESSENKASKKGVLCEYCGVPTTNTQGQPNSRERDHIDPRSRGGNNTSENERDSCRTCNREKGAKNPDEWRGK